MKKGAKTQGTNERNFKYFWQQQQQQG